MLAAPSQKRLLAPRGDVEAMVKSRKPSYKKAGISEFLYATICGSATRRYPLSYVAALTEGVRETITPASVKAFNSQHGPRLIAEAQTEWLERIDLYAAQPTPAPYGFLSTRQACLVLGMADTKVLDRGVKIGALTRHSHGNIYCYTAEAIKSFCEWPVFEE